MLLEDRLYFKEARDRGINAKSISMCSFFEEKIITRGYNSRENFRSQKLHISIVSLYYDIVRRMTCQLAV